jgi:hypothetical protein
VVSFPLAFLPITSLLTSTQHLRDILSNEAVFLAAITELSTHHMDLAVFTECKIKTILKVVCISSKMEYIKVMLSYVMLCYGRREPTLWRNLVHPYAD